MSHHPPLHPDESEPIALNPLLRGVDLAIGRLIRRNCFTGRTLDILDELREELLAVSSDTRPQGNPEMTLDDFRKIAEAATKGPWEYRGDYFGVRQVPTDQHLVGPNKYEMEGIVPGEYIRAEDAEFIATFNPQKVLEMIDQIEVLEHLQSVDEINAESDSKNIARLMEMVRRQTLAIEKQHARLAAVEKLHPNIHGECHTCSNENGPLNWPCPTIKAARGE